MSGRTATPRPGTDLAHHQPLLEAIRAVATAPSVQQAAPALLQALGVGLDWTMASLLIVDQEAQRLRLLDLWSPDPEHAAFVDSTRSLSFAKGEGMPGRCWEGGRPIWLEEIRQEPSFIRQAAARETGLVTGVWVPLRAEGTIIGILELFSAVQRPADEELMARLVDFGAVLGMALQRLRDAAVLTEREERLRAVIDGALDAVISIDAHGRVTEWNPQAERLFGWTASEARGRHLGELIVPERLREAHRAGMARLIATGQPRIIGQRLEMPAVDRSGREILVELTVSAHRTAGQPSFSAFLRDLTDQKEAEERIAILARLPEENPSPVLRIDANGILLYANRAGRRLLRRAPGARVGRWLRNAVRDSLERESQVELDHRSRGATFANVVVPIAERGYANVYALDITRRVETEAALRDLYLVTSEPGRTSSEQVAALLGLLRRRFGTGTAVLARVTPSALLVEQADAWDGQVARGVEFPLEETFGRRVVATREALVILDAAADAEHGPELAHTLHGLRSYIGAPVMVDGSLYGVVSFSSPLPRRTPFEPADLDYLQLVALWIGTEIERERSRAAIAAANLELTGAAAQARSFAEEAAAANRAKDDFLATVSHELRTPLTGILGMVDLLRGTRVAMEEQHYLEVLRSSGEKLLSIINELLDFSKIESGQMDIRPADFDPHQLVAEIAALHRPTARAKGLALRTIADPGVPGHVVGDAGRISQALGNLVSNAIKFTATGSVTIRLSGSGSAWLELSVADTGMGIVAEDRERLFEPFVQLDSSPARTYGGTGLGLAITHRLVNLMGGSIAVASEPGSGSTFTVRLPVLPRSPRQLLGQPDGGMLPPASPVRTGRRVLVVDDNVVNLELATTLLARMGHQSTGLMDGLAALRHLEHEPVDLLLLDGQLPDLDGFELARRIRQLEAEGRRRLPIVALTASAGDDARRRAREADIDDFLAKPYRAHEFQAKVERWLDLPGAPADDDADEGSGSEPELDGGSSGAGTSDRAPRPRPSRTDETDRAPGLLGEMAAITGPHVVRELVELFVAACGETGARLRAAADAGDRAEMARVAHSLRGSAGTLGADELATACGRLETAAAVAQRSLRVEVESVLASLDAAGDRFDRWLSRTAPDHDGSSTSTGPRP